MSEPILNINHLRKNFGKNEVLKDIDFSVSHGDVISIIGSSGSGKSTLLRCINLLETPTSGEILYHGEDITAKGFSVTGYRAKVGMVFQSFNLFNNMTVLKNCVVGQRKSVWRLISMQSRNSFPADKSSAWPLPERWQWNRRFCFLTSRLQLWTPRW